MKPLFWAALPLLLLTAAPALADPPSIEEIVQKTGAAMAQDPAQLSCRLEIHSKVFDRKGELEEQETDILQQTQHGKDVDLELLSSIKNGKDVTQEEKEKMAKEKAKKKNHKLGDDLHIPFDKKEASHYKFELLRQDQMAGRPVYVVKVTALKPSKKRFNGT